MKRRISVYLSIVLVISMVFTLSVIPVSAAATSGQCGRNLNWSYSNGVLTVSGSGAMYDYEEYLVYSTTAPWSDYRTSIRKVVIGNGVTSVGKRAFYGCQNIQQISLPDSLKTIGEYAFTYANIHSVLIPKSVTTIGEKALGYNYSGSSLLAPIKGLVIFGFAGTTAERYYKKVLQDYTALTGKEEVYFTPFKARLELYDVYESSWFGNDVKYVVDKSLMNGTSTHYFDPNSTTTRAQAVMILYRLAGSPSVSGRSFYDVSNSDWFYKAVEWASQKGIVSGYGNGYFGPNDRLNRQQLATVLYRYAQFKKYKTVVNGDIYSYSDGWAVSSYARDAMGWAIGKGLISGTDGNRLDPSGSATRAQLATILHRFNTNVR